MTKVVALGEGKKTVKIYESSDFVSCKQKLEPLKNKYTFDNDEEQTITAKINDLLTLSIFGLQPEYSLLPTIHRNTTDGKISKVVYSIRPKGAFRIPYQIKGRFEILADANFYSNFIEDLGNWFDKYNTIAFALHNSYVLTEKLYVIANKNNIALPFSIEFTVGNGIEDISNEGVVLGLDVEELKNLEHNPLFASTPEDLAYQNMEAMIVSYLSNIETFNDAVTSRNNPLVKYLGLPNTKLGTQIRKTVSKNLSAGKLGVNVHEGVATDANGNTAKYVALINRDAVTEEDAVALAEQGAIISDNTAMTKTHKEGNLTKIATSFRLNPQFRDGLAPVGFEKDLAEVTLEEVLEQAGLLQTN